MPTCTHLCPNCNLNPTDSERLAPENSGTDGYCTSCAADWRQAMAWAGSRGALPAPGALLTAYARPLQDLAGTLRDALQAWGPAPHGLSLSLEQQGSLRALEEGLAELERLLAAGAGQSGDAAQGYLPTPNLPTGAGLPAAAARPAALPTTRYED